VSFPWKSFFLMWPRTLPYGPEFKVLLMFGGLVVFLLPNFLPSELFVFSLKHKKKKTGRVAFSTPHYPCPSIFLHVELYCAAATFPPLAPSHDSTLILSSPTVIIVFVTLPSILFLVLPVDEISFFSFFFDNASTCTVFHLFFLPETLPKIGFWSILLTLWKPRLAFRSPCPPSLEACPSPPKNSWGPPNWFFWT